MPQPRRAIALSATLLTTAALALAVPTAAAARPTAPGPQADAALVQVHTSGHFQLAEGLYRTFASGYAYQVGIDADGQVLSTDTANGIWGQAAPASLGDADIVQLEAGYRHAVALDSAGHVTTWGYLGEPDFSDPDGSPLATVPADIASTTLQQVAAGGSHDLGLTTSGAVVGWGDDEGGSLDVPTDLGPVAKIDTGDRTSVALLTDGRVRSWGSPGDVPTAYADQTFVDVAAADTGVVALTANGDVLAWGNNGFGDVPSEVTDGTAVAIAGGTRAAAVLSDGSVVQWGGYAGQEINPPTVPASVPTVGLQWTRYASAVLSVPSTPAAPPTIAKVDGPHPGLAKLTADPGEWDTMTDPTFHYAWLFDGQPVGDDSPTLVVPWDDLGGRVAVVVTASDGSLFGRVRSAKVALQVPRARFDLTAPATAARGARIKARASGLAPNEPFVLVLDGRPIADGVATRKGKVDVRGTVPQRASTGRLNLVLVGGTEERFGRTTIVVTRR